MIAKLLGLFATILSITGCQTGIYIKDTLASMSDIRRAAVIVLGEPRHTSHSGRELTSKFHDKRGRIDEGLANAKSRYYTVVTILGDRRPYNIRVEVFQETKVEGEQYQIIGEDAQLAQKTAKKIERALNESLKNRNVIDDFRAF